MKKMFTKLYILGAMALTLLLTVVIWNLTFAHLVDDYLLHKRTHEIFKLSERDKKKLSERDKKSDEKITFQKAILDSEKRVKHYLGYRILEEKKLKGHFHHIDFDFKPDKRSYCIECHGDLPHDKVKEIRAFTNMHASFIACQTCHVKGESGGPARVFKWYDRSTGTIVDSPVREGTQPGAYEAKIIPYEQVEGELQPIDNQSRVDFAREYRENEKILSDIQKSKAKKIIHQIVDKKAYRCEDCHQKEAPALPFKDLGYSQKRINAFAGTEVVNMIKRYTEFYMPRILHPGFATEKEAKEPKKSEK